jgi:N4-gp56 family major capsid protein
LSLTNFAALSDSQVTIWSRELWQNARNLSFINKFAGTGSNAMVQRITELTKDEKGTRAVIQLVADLVSDGTAGDNTLEGRLEALRNYAQTIRFDQLRHGNEHIGRMSDQKTVVDFRTQSRDKLQYWLADRMDQMAFLTLSGISYSFKNTGAARTGSQLSSLEFAADVSAPTTNRHLRWVAASTELAAGATASVVATDTPAYKTLVALKAYAKTHYIRGIPGPGGEEVFHWFLTPNAMAKLRLDNDYILNMRHAGVRGSSNELFAGASSSVLMEGVMIHEFRHVYNTTGLTSGNKWGASGTVEGCRTLFCGAQALGFADIGEAYWVEEGKDFQNRQAITAGKMFGFLKPKFYSIYDEATEDFGVIVCDVAQ